MMDLNAYTMRIAILREDITHEEAAMKLLLSENGELNAVIRRLLRHSRKAGALEERIKGGRK